MGEITVLIPNEIPQLKDLDALLRCGICYEYMKTAMITTCSHNFCSLCIRQSLMYKARCPACFMEASDNQLRNNKIVDDIVKIFGRLLDEVKTFMQEYGKSSDPSKKVNRISNFIQNSNSLSDLKVKYNAVNKGIVNVVCSDQRETGEAFGKLPECASGPATSSHVPESEVELSDFLRLQNVPTAKELHQSPDHRRQVSKSEVAIPAMFTPKKRHNSAEKFPCPVCNVGIPEKNINVHLDACLKRSENFDQHTSPTKLQKRKPLPKLVYSLLQDKKLREILKQQGLSTHGDRKALVSRHQRFTLLYNSENDNLNPRSTADIIKQIEREEQEEKKLCATATSGNRLKIDRKTDPKLIEQAQQQYIKQNKSSFEKLIQSVRNREAGKNTAVKRKLILSDEENDSEDKNKEAQLQHASGRKCAVRIHVIVSDEEDDAVEKGHRLYQPSGDMSPISENVSDDGNISEETFDMNYEADTDALSPVLGRNVVTNCLRKEDKGCLEGEATDDVAADTFGKRVSRSNSGKCNSAAQQSEDVTRDEDSDTDSHQSISILSERTQETVHNNSKRNSDHDINEALPRLNSQLYDPDFEPYSEDTSDFFEIQTSPISTRRNARRSPQPSSSRGGRRLRKRAKY